jgi:hypothetical protein
VLATKRIEPGAELLIRYGHEYWLKRIDSVPFELSEAMFRKYRPTMKQLERKKWLRALKKNRPEKTEPVQVLNNNMFITATSYLCILNLNVY